MLIKVKKDSPEQQIDLSELLDRLSTGDLPSTTWVYSEKIKRWIKASYHSDTKDLCKTLTTNHGRESSPIIFYSIGILTLAVLSLTILARQPMRDSEPIASKPVPINRPIKKKLDPSPPAFNTPDKEVTPNSSDRVSVEPETSVERVDPHRDLTPAEISTAKRLYVDMQTLVAEGEEMQYLRDNDSLSSAKMCGEKMRSLLSRVHQVKKEVDAQNLPKGNPTGLGLGMASIDLKLCVTCSNLAIQYCQQTREALHMATEDLKN